MSNKQTVFLHPIRIKLILFLFLSIPCRIACFSQIQNNHARSITPSSSSRLVIPSRNEDRGVSETTSISPIRLNKVFKATHSRREADRIIQEGRVAINGVVSYGDMVVPFQDKVTLDGTLIQGWEEMNGLDKAPMQNESTETILEYVKYYKPRGVICTTDRRIQGNIIDALTRDSGYQPKHRVYPVGRLDKDSSGLILITSDGRIPNASLRQQRKQPKFYRVRVLKPLSEEDLEQLRSGIVITTVAQRDGNSKPLTAKTKPCTVIPLGSRDVEIVLEEGRNRQIRKMMEALGNEVIRLHRIRFGEISLDNDMSAGDWKYLSTRELRWIDSILEIPE